MKVAVIGLGSMGKRRIRLIKKYDPAISIFGVDTNEQRRKVCVEEYGIETYSGLNELFAENAVDCTFVCTSPLSHAEIITRCLKRKTHVFTELNLVSDGYEENISLAKENNVVLFMSSTFLFREEIRKIKTYSQDAGSPLNYTYHVGQYLPDWHPWEKYTDFFVSNTRTNACREIFAIELPWLIDVFGDIEKIDVVKNKISTLNIEYNDNYLLIVQHVSGNKGTMAVDIVSRKAVRNLEVFGETLYMQWDGSPKGLKVYNHKDKTEQVIEVYDDLDQLKGYSEFVVENAYLNEIVSFFKTIRGEAEPIYTFQKDWNVLKMIDQIEA